MPINKTTTHIRQKPAYLIKDVRFDTLHRNLNSKIGDQILRIKNN